MHKDLSSFKQEEPNQSIYCLTKTEINSQNLRLGPKNRTLLSARPWKLHDRIASSFPSTEDRHQVSKFCVFFFNAKREENKAELAEGRNCRRCRWCGEVNMSFGREPREKRIRRERETDWRSSV